MNRRPTFTKAQKRAAILRRKREVEGEIHNLKQNIHQMENTYPNGLERGENEHYARLWRKWIFELGQLEVELNLINTTLLV